jgi:hypothetical protein
MSYLVHNEKAKLLANALDRASTACLAIRVLGPLAAAFYSVSGFATGFWPFVVGALAWLIATFALHIEAQRVIGTMREDEDD